MEARKCTKTDLREARKALRLVAMREGVSVSYVEAEIQKAMLYGMNSSDPQVRAQWDRIPCAGDYPTPEEFIVWITSEFAREDYFSAD